MSFSPICLFTHNRLIETRQTIEALMKNYLAPESDLIIFSDGWKNKSTKVGVSEVRKYLRNVDGFKSIQLIEREENFGLAKSIISGVTDIIKTHGRAIVIEDDLITSPNFLTYMNKALDFYENNSSIWSVSGFSFPINYPSDYIYDATFGLRASSWGWATWSNRWNKVDWDVSDYLEFCKDKKSQKEFKRGGSDLIKMLNDQMRGKINSWAIRFCYAQFKNNAFDVYPKISKVINIGFSGNATNTKGMHGRFDTKLDDTCLSDFNLPKKIYVIPSILSQFQKPFSIYNRLKYKLLKLL